MKYSTQKVSGIIIGIGLNTEVIGYTETVLESFLPSDDELKKMSEKQVTKWTIRNNKRMEAICTFLNNNPDL
jgi:hypothetical protein